MATEISNTQEPNATTNEEFDKSGIMEQKYKLVLTKHSSIKSYNVIVVQIIFL